MAKLFVEKIQPQVLKNMKAFARRHNATVNDVLLTVYAAVLQEYVLDKFQTSMSIVPIRGAVDLRLLCLSVGLWISDDICLRIFETKLKTTRFRTGQEHLSRSPEIFFQFFMKLLHYQRCIGRQLRI